MFRPNIIFVICVFLNIQIYSQCIPDINFIPIDANYGLSPDSLAVGYINQEYNQDLTFFLPLDTLVDVEGFGETLIIFEDYHISSISLPIGLSWTCNNAVQQCHYDPTVTQYGCVNIYGIPLQYGEFDVEVSVIATHELSWAVGPEEITFSLPLNILPNFSANDGFAMANFSGCAPLTVDFTNNNPGLESYYWSFGNGNENFMENPSSQLFAEPGVYEVHYLAYSNSEPSYFLTSVQVQNASGWDGDAEDFFGFQPPDPFFNLFDSNGNLIFSSDVQVDNSFPVSWQLDNISLSNQNYTLEVWDEDDVLTDNDYLGSIIFNGNSNSSTITNGDLVVTYSITQIQPSPTADVFDTVYVYETPASPQVSYDDNLFILSAISDSLNLSYQWYFNQSPIPGANSLSYSPIYSGFYYLLATNEFGCSASSEEQLITICDDEYTPNIDISFDTLSFIQSSYFNYQWLFEGQEIAGANSFFLLAQESGNYSLLLTDQWGCKFISNDIFFNTMSVFNLEKNKLSIFPNPASDYIDVLVSSSNSVFDFIKIFDMQGRLVYSQKLWLHKHRIDISSIERGSYLIEVFSKKQKLAKRIILN
tara:strand:+ start:7620 stop:9389 length:1770 start_codon:yes stop_codon:yes gene_type:complete